MPTNHSRIEGHRVTKVHTPRELKPVLSEKDLEHLDKGVKKSPLDGEDAKSRLKRIKDWWTQAVTTLADSRKEMMTDHDYYDGEQWTREERAELEARGQEPVVFNMIATSIDWLLGAEKKNRVDWHVLPRARADSAGAEAKTKLLKYVSDVNNLSLQRSTAFEDAVKGGLGWLEVGVRSDPTKEPIYVQYEDWRNIWYDPLARRLDLTDSRFLFRAKWLDLDVAMTMWPGRASKIKAAAYSGRPYFDDQLSQDFSANYDEVQDLESSVMELGEIDGENQRSRVRVIECWYRVPVAVRVLKGEDLGALDGEEYDETNPDHEFLVNEGYAEVLSAIKNKVRYMIYTGNVVIDDGWSPYRHDRFPFVPIWGKRRKKDGAPYGPTRNMRSPQGDLNKRRSKALFILSTNKIVADDDATDDWEELQDEAARPDGVVRKRRGSELQIYNETALADAHTQLMQQDTVFIQDASGVTNENLGRDTNAISGKAITAKQEQGMTVTLKLFDNHRHAYQLLGEITLSLIEQFYSEQKQVRITKAKGVPEWLEINMPQPDGTLLNDITASKADFILSESDYGDTLRQALFDSLSEMITRIDPGIAMQLLDIVIDLSDLPGKDEILERVREVTGMDDPYADPDDPKAMAKKQQKEQAKAEQADMERQRLLSELEQVKADVEKSRAQTQQYLYQAEKTRYEAIIALARVDTERARQEAMRAGINFDEIKLKIEKAKALNDIENGEVSRSQLKQQQRGSDSPAQSTDKKAGQYHERGLSSNNKKQRLAGSQ